jgi:plastocyanin
MKRNMIWIAALLVGFMLACSDDDNNDQPITEVGMSNTAFIPEQVSISAGTTVRWVNNSSIPHTVTSNDGLFDEFLEVNETFSFTFNTSGTFLYVCTLHPGMDGVVTVE